MLTTGCCLTTGFWLSTILAFLALVDSPKLNSTALVAVQQSVTSAGWVASGATGHYRQAITLPAGFEFDLIQIGFRKTTGEVILPTVEKIDSTQYYVYSTDNTLALSVVYGG